MGAGAWESSGTLREIAGDIKRIRAEGESSVAKPPDFSPRITQTDTNSAVELSEFEQKSAKITKRPVIR
jgi:hypothetical protein